MDAILQALGSIGFFASRAFLPAFVTALLLRVGPSIPGLEDTGFVLAAGDAPTWFTSWWTILLLGVLSVLEAAAAKSADARSVLIEFERYLKPAMAVLVWFGIARSTDVDVVEQITREGGFLDALPALLIGALTYWLAGLRGGFVELLVDADEDDDAGIQGLISWAEDLWAACGPLLLVLFPIVMGLIVAAVVGGLWLARRAKEHGEDKARLICARCGKPVYRAAPRCGACGQQVAQPADIGFFGTALARPAADLERHPLRLVEKKRCPVCATRLASREPRQRCPACGHELFADPAFAGRYLAEVRARLPSVLVVSALFSLIPVAGLLPGVIWYRLALVAPLRRYVPRGRAFALKWGVRILFVLLAAIQWMPAVGVFVVPVMALVNYGVWRAAFVAGLAVTEPAALPAQG